MSGNMNASAKRNLVIIGGVVLVGILAVGLVMYVGLGSGKKGGSEGSVDVRALSSAGALTEKQDGPASEGQRKALAAVQQQEAASAAAAGRSYIPPDQSQTPVPVGGPSASAEQRTNAEVLAQQQIQMESERKADQERSRQDSLRREGLERQLKVLVDASPVEYSVERVSFRRNDAPQAQQAQASAPVAAASAASAVEPGYLVQGYQIVAAETASPFDNYKTPYASARIVAGPLAGALLFGKGTVQDEGLQLTFTKMSFGGKAYVINAIGLDEKTATDAMSAEVDRRYLERYFIPVVLAGAQGYQQSKANAGQTVVSGPQGTTVATPAASAQQARSAGLAKGMEVVNTEVQKEVAKPVQLTLKDRTPMGVMFLEPVKLGSEMK